MFDKITSIITEYVDIAKEDITKDTEFLADLKMSSLDIMTMICQLEDEFGIEIETERLSEIFTIQDLLDYLEEQINEN